MKGKPKQKRQVDRIENGKRRPTSYWYKSKSKNKDDDEYRRTKNWQKNSKKNIWSKHYEAERKEEK